MLSCGTKLIEDDWFFPGCSDPAIVSGQQELEEELATVQGVGRLQQARRKGSQTSRKLQVGSKRYEFIFTCLLIKTWEVLLHMWCFSL